MPQTLVEKILLAHTDASDLQPGDVVIVRCDVVMANDVSGPLAFRAMERMGAERVFDPSRVVMVADHFVPAKDARSAELQAHLELIQRRVSGVVGEETEVETGLFQHAQVRVA